MKSPEKAIEFAEYMAKSAERLLDAVNALSKVQIEQEEADTPEDARALDDAVLDALELQSEAMGGVRNDIYEFRKRVP